MKRETADEAIARGVQIESVAPGDGRGEIGGQHYHRGLWTIASAKKQRRQPGDTRMDIDIVVQDDAISVDAIWAKDGELLHIWYKGMDILSRLNDAEEDAAQQVVWDVMAEIKRGIRSPRGDLSDQSKT